eukprot:CAMPEP_0201575966 /NCGR_PEP_ID=MMETSP0190_2-20130828/21474_1 /ASSEMBLY_ACC=CAM_ASM_000263 /TAXON_ID=37353 /ORGANISM="Rosalina sp." /LENGTH=791 /DNA_ID=CAMNT_0048006257 /DNA_START=189 /DNA_END=2567 /DNA_ORIENTATION=+
MPANGNCSYVKRVYGAEINGATAVLLGNDDEQTGSVIPIIDDQPTDDEGNIIVTSIPARMIPYGEGTFLSLGITIGEHPDREDNYTLKIEFGCLSVSDPDPILCVVDQSGDHWWMDGDYQYQVALTKTGAPVWLKEGYLLVLDVNHYIFLHDGDGQAEFYWAITEDPAMEDDDYIVAKCETRSITNPMDCQAWSTTDYYLTGELTFTLNDKLMINNSLCEVTDNRVCIKSERSTLAGLYGTYRQYNSKAPYWFREWVDCDTQSGWLTFVNYEDYGQFLLIDPFDFWIVAECIITGYTFEEREETIAFKPDLCKEWNTLIDGSLDANHKIYDPTMDVTSDSCGNYICPDDFNVPDDICMTRNSIMHSFLEGEYTTTGVTGSKYNTSEWSRSDKLYYGDGTFVPVYLWYYGEVNDDLHWWVIANNNLSTAIANNGSSVYGFCPSYTNSPTNCLSCWNFYFSGDEDIAGAWHSDCKFEMLADECDTDTDSDPGTTFNWPEYLCVRENVSDVYSGNLDWDLLKGGYEMNDTITRFSGVPFWVKPPNKYNEDYTYIYYDSFYGYWQIGDELHVESTLICSQSANEYLPTECNIWYDTQSRHVGNAFIFSGINCDESDVLRLEEEESSDNTAVVVVLVILAIIACLIAGFFYFKHYQKKQRESRGPWTATKVATGGVGSSDDMMEMGDADRKGLVGDGGTRTGGMDMSPLNVEGNGTKYDDDDDITVDAQQNDIDDGDDDDDEEQLIAGNGTTKGGDDLRLPSDNDEDPEVPHSPDPDVEDADGDKPPAYTSSIMDE